ncbi:hypothetical protein DIPPA_02907 [Diplonema papillatum]|nr:hypothetical protein DIPPA_02907 [Diplonema papillatum]
MGDSRLLVCFDGGARANGTAFAVAGAGAVMYRDGVKVSEVILPLPTVRSNNVAEYEAVLAGLHLLNEANDADGTQCTAANCFNTGVDNKVHYVPFGADLEIALTTYAVYVQSAMSAMSLRAAADRVNKSGAIIKKMDALPKTMSRAACEEALRKIMCSEIPDAFEAQAAALWFIDHGKLRTVSSDGISLCTDAVGIVGAVGTGQIRVFNSAENVVAHPSYKAAIDNVHGFPIETVIALPLSQAGTCLGVLQVVNKTTLGVTAFTDEEQTILQQIATIAAMHLSCAQ